MPQLEALLDADYERKSAIEERIWDTPAVTLQGVVIRLREAHLDLSCNHDFPEPGEDFYVDAFEKVLRNLERLAGEA